APEPAQQQGPGGRAHGGRGRCGAARRGAGQGGAHPGGVPRQVGSRTFPKAGRTQVERPSRNLLPITDKAMKYISTRGGVAPQSFEDVVLAGLAPDGGLFVPESLPSYSTEEIASWAGLPYTELAFRVMAPFIDGAVPDEELRRIIAI